MGHCSECCEATTCNTKRRRSSSSFIVFIGVTSLCLLCGHICCAAAAQHEEVSDHQDNNGTTDHSHHHHDHDDHHHHHSNKTIAITPAFFISIIFNNTETMSKQDLQSLLTYLQTGQEEIVNHNNGTHEHDDNDERHHQHHDNDESEEEHEKHDEHHNHDHSIDNPTQHDHHHEDEDEHQIQQQRCLSVERLLEIYGIENQSSISPEQFPLICPALLHQHMSKSCQRIASDHDHDHASSTTGKSVTSDSERYGYGTVAVFIISYLPLVILVVIPDINHPHFLYVMHGLVALGTSTMISDAILHLLPAAFGLHSHSHGGEDHEEEAEEAGHSHSHSHNHGEGAENSAEFSPALLKGVTFCGALYAMYLLEMLIGTRSRVNQGITMDHTGGHGHSHGIPSPASSVNTSEQTDESSNNGASSEGTIVTLKNDGTKAVSDRTIAKYIKGFIHDCIPPKSFGWMLIIADGIHNFMDGLAVGATFSMGVSDGISTSLAILFHEIPHEYGDFAALLSTGMSWRGCMVWNIIQTFTAFIGLYVGLGVSTDEASQQFVYAVTAAIFFHVALSGLLPELNNITKHFWFIFFLQNIGIQVGFWIMFVIAIYEDSMSHMLD